MAAIRFNSEHRREAVQGRPNGAMTALRVMLDAFVSNRLGHSAAQTSHVRARKSARMPGTRFGSPLSDHATHAVRLQPLDPNVVNPAIAAFFIGHNEAGLWVAREAKGRIGGIFLFKRSALAFAHAQSEPAGCAMIFQSERFELDLQNNGNRFANWFAPFMRIWRKL